MNDDTKSKEENAIRAVLRNEITWIVFIVGAIWGMVAGVVLPLQKLQLQVAQIQMDIADFKTTNTQIMAEHKEFQERLSVLETKMGLLTSRNK